MSLGKLASITAFVALSLAFVGCGGGGSSGSSTNDLLTAVQDLTVDPSGTTTVLTFESSDGLAGASTTNFEADGGQTATSVAVAGNEVTIEWSARVSPSDAVRATGLSDVSNTYLGVVASDTSAPTFTITNGTQTLSVGGDSFDVEFSGPHVLENEVESIANWNLKIGTTSLDLTGSTIVFDENTQTATFTLGSLANLHATYTLRATSVHAVSDVAVSSTAVAGTATGDSTAPTLTSANQNLTADEFGRVIDFTFSEPMDPVFAVQTSHFGVTSPDVATSVTIPSANVLRVTFNNPIVPGTDTVDLSGLVDAHGNDFVDVTQAISQPSPVVNAFDGTPEATTVANAGGDTITVVTTQAFDPDTAVDPAAWTVEVNSVPIVLADQELEYDLASKTLTITLDADLDNGDSFTVQGVSVKDVDGQTFTLSSGGTAAGDATPPTITFVTQNRNVDTTGKTLIVQFSEDVDETTAENLGNWSETGPNARTLVSATLLTGNDSVALVYDDVIVPGDYTIDLVNVEDLAGNTIVAVTNVDVGTTDATVPTPATVTATAIEGFDNDTLTVTFDDSMIESEVETIGNWALESPVGTPVTLTGATLTYSGTNRTATLVLDNGFNYQRGDGVKLTLSTCRDISGNPVSSTPVTTTIVPETTLPVVHTIYRDSTSSDQLVVTFSEPCTNLDDLYDASTNTGGIRYVLRTSGGTVRGVPTAASVESSGLAARLSFGFVVNSTDTLDVVGAVDLCGNPGFPYLAVTTVPEDTSTPSLATGFSAAVTVSGEANDELQFVFDRPMNPLGILDPSNYTLSGTGPIDLTFASFAFDGTDTVTVGLRTFSGHNLQTGSSYSISANNLWSAQGVQRTTADTESGIVAAGDAVSPTVAVGSVKIDPTVADSLLIEANESLDLTACETAANYDYNGGNIAVSATRVGLRTIRATFSVTPTAGQNLQFTVKDLAGNVSGTITRAVAAADTTAPLVSSVSGTITPNRGGDRVVVTFSESVNSQEALASTSYTITSGSRTMDVSAARIAANTASNSVTIFFPKGQELLASGTLSVTVRNVKDMSGNAMPAAVTLNGSVSGDTTAPTFSSAFVNYRLDPTGRTVDVLFDEDVDSVTAVQAGFWASSGNQTILSITNLEANHYRVALATAMGANDELTVVTLPDLAGNVATSIDVDPVE